ncbi:hypothetical protein [Moorena sp. SIO3H5]|uniref:hypothetical protein n=1 Tax=Moorena sp. SIO3H5 TaxID=2607834 RepID=UPI0013BD17E0|nr:hypothetical protein [Moorena sp. SIO3H5]NEO69749.1 hypothetical protein [Moorena sp. SIO3H5]
MSSYAYAFSSACPVDIACFQQQEIAFANTSSLSLVRRRAIDLWSRYAIAFF